MRARLDWARPFRSLLRRARGQAHRNQEDKNINSDPATGWRAHSAPPRRGTTSTMGASLAAGPKGTTYRK
ncbi:hypothetical protein EMCLV150L [Equine molluscum contagiosum-like virus]|nr:hypothetical protein EMCLV150L [Equine molluscum contagiosum-like virus]